MRYQKADLRQWRPGRRNNWSFISADWFSTPARRTRYAMTYTAWVLWNRRFRKLRQPALLPHLERARI